MDNYGCDYVRESFGLSIKISDRQLNVVLDDINDDFTLEHILQLMFGTSIDDNGHDDNMKYSPASDVIVCVDCFFM